ncbi:MAG: DUF4988 domain-containing protein [Bacteroides sp.]|nr:DUF4988 domain-containing protein [Bacteroides sp.]
MWEISTDEGDAWTSTGVQATGDIGVTGARGDSFFYGIDTDNGDYIVLTLMGADGSSAGEAIQLPRYKAFRILTGSEIADANMDTHNSPANVGTYKAVFYLSFPSGFTKDNYAGITAEVISNRGTSADVRTRTGSTLYSVAITQPEFDVSTGAYKDNAKIIVEAPSDINKGESAMLRVTLPGNDGSELVATRMFIVKLPEIGDYYYSDGTFSTELDVVNKTPIGVIFYVGDVANDDTQLKDKIGDTATGDHCLVVGLKNKSNYWKLTVGDTPASKETDKMVGYSNTLSLLQYNREHDPTDAALAV